MPLAVSLLNIPYDMPPSLFMYAFHVSFSMQRLVLGITLAFIISTIKQWDIPSYVAVSIITGISLNVIALLVNIFCRCLEMCPPL
jgi:hypothetical protein